MQIETIDSKTGLLKNKEQILSLFAECFGKELEPDIWDWAYINNIFGDPIVTILRDEGRIVAHYAVIPFFLQNGLGKMIKSYIAITTMIAKSHLARGLFAKLAEATYQRLVEKNGEMVIGFPNNKAAPGIRKYLQWSLGEIDYVAAADYKEICSDDLYKNYISDPSRFSLNLEDSEIRAWRMSRPYGRYKYLSGCIVKEFGDTYDLIWVKDADALSSLPRDKKINFLVDATNKRHINNKIFDYQFGYRSFSPEYAELKICKTLSLSDVF